MVRIGNDIVDLKVAAAESNWQRRGFLDKVFTEAEQEVILSSKSPFQMAWRMWSMKESAYKAYIQETKNRFFNPKSFQCKFIDSSNGTVFIKGTNHFTKTISNDSVIFTSSSIDKSTTLNSMFFQVHPNSQSDEVHSALIEFIADRNNLDVEGLAIIKSANKIPNAYFGNERLPLTISTTHHGNFGAYSVTEL